MSSNEDYLDQLLQSVSSETEGADEKKKEPQFYEKMSDEKFLEELINKYGDDLAEFAEHDTSNDVVDNQNEETEAAVADLESFNEDEITEQMADEMIAQIDPEMEVPDGPALPEPEVIEPAEFDRMIENLSNNENEMADVPEEADAPNLADEPIDDSQAEETTEITGLSEEEIDALIQATSQAPTEVDINSLENDNQLEEKLGLHNVDTGADVTDLLDQIGAEDELAEINDLLKKSDKNVNVDDSIQSAFDSDISEGGNNILKEMNEDTSDSGNETDIEDDNKKIEKKKKVKVKKEKISKEKEQKDPNKKNFIQKILALLTDEDDLDEAALTGEIAGVSAENAEIMADLSAEDSAEIKAKKKKEKKIKPDKKAKKGKTEALPEGDGTEEVEEKVDPKEKAAQEKKKAKADAAAEKKKKKQEKAEADKAFLKAQPKIANKRVITVALFAISLTAVILIIYHFVPENMAKNQARKAFYNHEYQEAFELLYGCNLNDSDSILLNKVTYILKLQNKMDSYDNYQNLGMDLDALNALMEGVVIYDEIHISASALGIGEEVDKIYDDILTTLNGKYNITEEMAKEINAYEDDALYSLRLEYIISGQEWPDGSTSKEQAPMEDILDEETDFIEDEGQSE